MKINRTAVLAFAFVTSFTATAHAFLATPKPCLSESDQLFCAVHGKNCDSYAQADNCGRQRSVNCGSCSGAQICGGTDEPNVCGLPSYVPPSATWTPLTSESLGWVTAIAACDTGVARDPASLTGEDVIYVLVVNELYRITIPQSGGPSQAVTTFVQGAFVPSTTSRLACLNDHLYRLDVNGTIWATQQAISTSTALAWTQLPWTTCPSQVGNGDIPCCLPEPNMTNVPLALAAVVGSDYSDEAIYDGEALLGSELYTAYWAFGTEEQTPIDVYELRRDQLGAGFSLTPNGVDHCDGTQGHLGGTSPANALYSGTDTLSPGSLFDMAVAGLDRSTGGITPPQDIVTLLDIDNQLLWLNSGAGQESLQTFSPTKQGWHPVSMSWAAGTSQRSLERISSNTGQPYLYAADDLGNVFYSEITYGVDENVALNYELPLSLNPINPQDGPNGTYESTGNHDWMVDTEGFTHDSSNWYFAVASIASAYDGIVEGSRSATFVRIPTTQNIDSTATASETLTLSLPGSTRIHPAGPTIDPSVGVLFAPDFANNCVWEVDVGHAGANFSSASYSCAPMPYRSDGSTYNTAFAAFNATNQRLYVNGGPSVDSLMAFEVVQNGSAQGPLYNLVRDSSSDFYLTSAGAPYTVYEMQAGVFSSEGHFYLVNSPRAPGVTDPMPSPLPIQALFVFDQLGRLAMTLNETPSSFCPSFEGPDCNFEAEGIALWDIDPATLENHSGLYAFASIFVQMDQPNCYGGTSKLGLFCDYPGHSNAIVISPFSVDYHDLSRL